MNRSKNTSEKQRTGSTETANDLPFNDESNNKKKKESFWKHIIYNVCHFLYEQFRNPNRKPAPSDLDFIRHMDFLLGSGITAENVKNVKELAKLHRITDDTKARKRLEKWSKRVIVTYLVCVLCIIVLNYGSLFNPRLLNIPESIMTIILSTTTINIIALVVIVLKGHFFLGKYNNDDEMK